MLKKTFLTKPDEKKAVEKISKDKDRLLQSRKDANSLLKQYERIVKEQRKLIHDLMNNLPKMIYIYLHNRFKKKGGIK